MRPRWPAGDSGVAAVLVLALSAVLALLAALAVLLGTVAVARHQVAATADLAALAAADRYLEGSGPACAAATRVVSSSYDGTAALTRCVLLDGERVEVVVALRPAGVVGRIGVARSTARAGP